jgi:predicted outer membrane protein
MSTLVREFAAALGLCAIVSAAALAQEQREQVRQPDRTAAGQQQAGVAAQTSPRTDAILANWLLVDNENEVALAQLAQQRAQETEVKQFAQRMIDDHQQFIGKLQRFAGPEGRRDPNIRREGAARNQEETRDEVEQATPRTAQAPARQPQPAAQQRQPGAAQRGQGGMLNHVALKRELGEQCLQTARRELEQKKGIEFDQCFMFQQAMMHMQAVDTMTVFKKHASPELRQVLEEGIQTAQQHLEHAKDLAKKLEGE